MKNFFLGLVTGIVLTLLPFVVFFALLGGDAK